MSDWPIPGTYESYKKSILVRQVAAQERAVKYAREGLQAERATRDVMVATIEGQTAELRATLDRSADRIANELADQGDRITSELTVQSDRICGSLDEIRWEVAQVGRTMNRLLQVALNSRTNEANQLVKQGVRHFANDEYLEAEGRFLKALDYDSTDYQVLMNLGFIAVHKEQPDAAFTYFKKALTLPDSLNDPAKARALWALARVHYSQKRFPEAYASAEQAKALSTPVRAADILTVGVYAAPLGKTDLAIQHCRQALILDPPLYSTIAAYAELDLQPIRDNVLTMLVEMTEDALKRAMRHILSVQRALSKATEAPQASHYADLLEVIRKRISEAETRLRHASYEDCLKLSESTKQLVLIPDEISRLDANYAELPRAIEKVAKAEARHQTVLDQSGKLSEVPPPLEPLAEGPAPREMGCGLGVVLYLLPGLGGAFLGSGFINPIILIVTSLFWPFVMLGMIPAILSPTDPKGEGPRYLVGLLIGAAASVAVWFYFVKLPRERLEAVKRENARRSEENTRCDEEIARRCGKIGNSKGQINQCRQAVEAVKKDIETRRAKILQDLTQALFPPKEDMKIVRDATTDMTTEAGIAAEAEIGKVYRGKVVTIKEFGAFVEFLPGKDGLVHISELAEFRVKKTEDIVKVGDEIWVKCLGVDEKGRVRLSRKAAMAERDQEKKGS